MYAPQSVTKPQTLLPPPCRYWYPLTYFLSLALQPTALIALDETLEMPKFPLDCTAKPSLFAYPTPVSVEAKAEVSKVRKTPPAYPSLPLLPPEEH